MLGADERTDDESGSLAYGVEGAELDGIHDRFLMGLVNERMEAADRLKSQGVGGSLAAAEYSLLKLS